MRARTFAQAGLLTAAVFLALAAQPARASAEMFSDGGFETGSLGDWTVLTYYNTTPIRTCTGTPHVQPVGTGPGAGQYRLTVDDTSGGSPGPDGYTCATVRQMLVIDPYVEYVLHFEGTVMDLSVHDSMNLFFSLDTDGVFNNGRGWTIDRTLRAGFCRIGGRTCVGAVEFAFAVVGSLDGPGYLDNVSMHPVDAAIPEPGVLPLLGAALAGLALSRGRRSLQS